MSLYAFDLSAPCVAVYLTQAALGLNYKRIQVNLWKNEQFSPGILKLNPQHTVPILVEEDGSVIWDSHAINIYLCENYGKNQNLYPEDDAKRALINQRLFFDASMVFPLVQKCQLLRVRRRELSERNIATLCDVYDILNNFIKDGEWVAGDSVTLADFSLIPSITLAHHLLVPIDVQKYPNVIRWINNAEQLPFYYENTNYLTAFSNFLHRPRRVKSGL